MKNCEWNNRITELISLARLDDDWNGYGSPAPSVLLISGALRIAMKLKSGGFPPPNRVGATVGGTVCLEWHSEHGYEDISNTDGAGLP
jgi:hypothetical protein